MTDKILYNFLIALDAIQHNRLRALLTSLGIIFGVASVIAMLAIGKGAQEEILNQIKLLGANNVIITSVIEQEEGAVGEEEGEESGGEAGAQKKPFSPGLTRADAQSIAAHVPGVAAVSPEVIVETVALRAGLRRSTKVIGVDQAYFQSGDFALAEGSYFTQRHLDEAMPVAVIGFDVKAKFFPKSEAIGGRIKVGKMWVTVVGVLRPRDISSDNIERLGIRNFDLDVYTPISTMLLRFENRAQLTQQDLQESQRNRRRGIADDPNYHQIDRLVVRVERSDLVSPVAEVISRMLERRHHGVVDYEVVVPEVLLAQERRTQRIFNIVLAAIASISLIVGGIGIMNIMLASVMERIREIGLRRSLGATRHDVTLQFLIEALTISFTGGLLGVLLGVGFSISIEYATGIVTIVSWWSVVLAFLVAAGVGLVFGLVPARRAAEHDPVVALRYE